MIGTFLLGALGYPALEVITRGRTHYSMGIAGGLSLLLIRRIGGWRGPVLRRAGLCAAGITAVEYACGRIWNRNFRVWDYRRMPLNYRGQICLPYSLLWIPVSAVGLLLHDAVAGKRGQSRE